MSKTGTGNGSKPTTLKRYFVTGSKGGGWAIFREGEARPLQTIPRKVAALETARTMARYNAPSQVIVEQEDGNYLLQYDFTAATV